MYIQIILCACIIYLLTFDDVKLGAVNLCGKGVVLNDVLVVVGSKQTIVTNKTEEHRKLSGVCAMSMYSLYMYL